MNPAVLLAAVLRGLGLGAAPQPTRLLIRDEQITRPAVTDERITPTHVVTDTQLRPTT